MIDPTSSSLAPEFLLPLLLALGIGLLIGVERGWQFRSEKAGQRVAGIRTFALLGLLGGVVGIEAGRGLLPLALILAAGGVAALLLAHGVDMMRSGNVSATSAVAGIATIGLGAAATAGQTALACVAAGAMAILLAARAPLHRAIRATSPTDMQALMRLVLVVLVILPLLPNAAMGPFGALNPRRLWLVVVVTVGIAFAGYVLSRWLGERRGTLVAAAVGALISSTAVTLDNARRIRDGAPASPNEAGVAIAQVVMLGRGLFLVSLLAPLAFPAIARLVAPGLALSLAAAAALLWRARSADAGPSAARAAKAPGLWLALWFAVSVGALSVATAWTEARFGSGSGAFVIALGGTADIDSAIAAVGSLPPGRLPLHLAALAIAAPILFNTLLKLAILLAVGGLRRTAFGAASLLLAAIGLGASIAAAAL